MKITSDELEDILRQFRAATQEKLFRAMSRIGNTANKQILYFV